jgi:hypothetical protein
MKKTLADYGYPEDQLFENIKEINTTKSWITKGHSKTAYQWLAVLEIERIDDFLMMTCVFKPVEKPIYNSDDMIRFAKICREDKHNDNFQSLLQTFKVLNKGFNPSKD